MFKVLVNRETKQDWQIMSRKPRLVMFCMSAQIYTWEETTAHTAQLYIDKPFDCYVESTNLPASVITPMPENIQTAEADD
jgi:hypothetical protein